MISAVWHLCSECVIDLGVDDLQVFDIFALKVSRHWAWMISDLCSERVNDLGVDDLQLFDIILEKVSRDWGDLWLFDIFAKKVSRDWELWLQAIWHLFRDVKRLTGSGYLKMSRDWELMIERYLTLLQWRCRETSGNWWFQGNWHHHCKDVQALGDDDLRVSDTITVKMSMHWEMTISGYLTHHYKDVQVLKLTIFRCLRLCNGGTWDIWDLHSNSAKGLDASITGHWTPLQWCHWSNESMILGICDFTARVSKD